LRRRMSGASSIRSKMSSTVASCHLLNEDAGEKSITKMHNLFQES
jgi:hypothetical protein